jgi:signal transduction histidine kinase
MFPWQFQLEADQRYSEFIESKKSHLQRRLASTPDDPDLLVKLGRLNYYLILSRRVELIPETTAIFDRVLGLKPNDPVALSYHGSLLMWSRYLSLGGRRGETPELQRGLKELSQAAEMAPDNLEVRMLRANSIIYGLDSYPERWMAIADLQKSIAIMEETYKLGIDATAEIRLSLGDTYFSLGRVREAQAEWQYVVDHSQDAGKRSAAEVRLHYRQGLSSSQHADWKDVLTLLALLLGIVSLGVVATQPLRGLSWRRAPLSAIALAGCAAGIATLVLLLMRMVRGDNIGPAGIDERAVFGIGIATAVTGLVFLRITREPLADTILQRGGVAALFALVTVALFQYVLAPASWQMVSAGAGALFTVLMAAVWTALAVSFPFVQRGVSRFVNRRLFHREESTRFLHRLGNGLVGITSETELLQYAERELGRYLRVRWVRCIPLQDGDPNVRGELQAIEAAHSEPVVRTTASLELSATQRASGRVERILFLRPSTGTPVAILIGGRTILSGEDEVLALVAVQLGSTLDNLRLHEDLRQRAVAQESLARLATQAELRALRAQIHPHFLFNTLNSIAGLIQMDPKRAESLVEELSELLRYRFRVAREFIPLGEELSLVSSYLDIEQVRLGARMRLERDVQPEALAVPVPPLILQPLVENAVTHGIARKVEGGCVKLGARITGERLELRVEDDGAGMPVIDDDTDDEAESTATERRPSYGTNGVGLANVLARLQRIYGDGARAEVESEPGRGTRILLVLPLVPPTEHAVASGNSERR